MLRQTTPALMYAGQPSAGRQTTYRFSSVALFSLLLLFGQANFAAEAQQPPKDAAQFFENQVRPLLANRCFSCHGEKKQESDLRLDARSAILQGGASGDAAAEVGNPDASVMIQYVRREVEGMEMPPDKPLNQKEIAVLEQWVRSGLFWPEDDIVNVESMDDRFSNHVASHWAFQPINTNSPDRSAWPAYLQQWPTTQLDDFVAENLHRHDITPTHAADRSTLLRRLKFDLLGLPPTYEETTQFQNDPLPDAYERLVD